MKENYRAGYEGQDSQRAKAEKMLGGVEKESLKVKASKSAVGAEKPRPYKAGGAVKKATGGRASRDTGSNAEESRAERDYYPMPKKAAPARDFKKGGEAGIAKKKVSSELQDGRTHSKPVMGKRLVEKEGFSGGEKLRDTFAKAMKGGGSAKSKDCHAKGGEVRLNIESLKEVPKKKGGEVKRMAMGGSGKIRKSEMTPSGKIIKQARKPRTRGM